MRQVTLLRLVRPTFLLTLTLTLAACERTPTLDVPTGARLQVSADTNVSVDFDTSTGVTATTKHYGTNAYSGTFLDRSGNATYRANVDPSAYRFVRYHTWEMMNNASTHQAGWLTNEASDTPGWDGNRVRAVLANMLGSGGPWRDATVVMNIPGWPSGWKQPGSEKLRSDRYAQYAEWCKGLVDIVRGAGYNVVYWEVTNERDDVYADNPAELAKIYNTVVNRIKQSYSGLKYGGPSFARPDLVDARVKPFLSAAHGNIDFLSWHSYSNGDTGASNASVDVGAVYDALAMRAITKAGAGGANAWNEADGWYGKLDANFARRPASYVYEVFNKYLTGTVVSDTAGNTSSVVAYGVKTDTRKSVALINRSGAARTVALTLTGVAPNATATVYRVTSSGLSSTVNVAASTLTNGSYSLPVNSVTVAVFEGSTPPPASGTNLLTNPGFESGLTSWGSGSGGHVSDARGGTGALRLASGSSGHGPQSVSVTAGATYTLSAWCKKGGTGDSGSVGVQYPNGAKTFWDCTSGTSYVQVQKTFTVPTGQGSVSVNFWNNWGSQTWDDLSLTRQ